MIEEDQGELEPHTDGTLTFDFRRYLEALTKYVWAILALVALAITGAVIYTSRQPRIYEATASVQIEPRLPDVLGQGQQDLLNMAVGGTMDYYKQQLKLLSSFSLVRLTVERDQLYAQLVSESERSGKEPKVVMDLAAARLRPMIR